MGFGINYIPFAPYGAGYDKLLKHHDTRKPIRGRDELRSRPYGGRRQELFIRKEESTGNLIIRMYSTDLATFSPDGTIRVTSGGWVSVSTAYVLSEILGVSVRHSTGRLWVACEVEGADEPTKNTRYFPLADNQPTATTFRRGREPYAKLHFVPTPERQSIFPIVYKIDRKAANAARKGVRGFREYFKNMYMLCDGEFADNMYREIFGLEGRITRWSLHGHGSMNPEGRANMLHNLATTPADSPNADQNYLKAALLLAMRYKGVTYMDTSHKCRKLLEHFSKVILWLNEGSVFVRTTDKSGIIRRDVRRAAKHAALSS